jgi:hypothetical protein
MNLERTPSDVARLGRYCKVRATWRKLWLSDRANNRLPRRRCEDRIGMLHFANDRYLYFRIKAPISVDALVPRFSAGRLVERVGVLDIG